VSRYLLLLSKRYRSKLLLLLCFFIIISIQPYSIYSELEGTQIRSLTILMSFLSTAILNPRQPDCAISEQAKGIG